ncbi:MAG: hypothetical protein HUJ30_02460 [Gammaproteobacteria bacterium]|nr:hypothetical protein [Gammaproteobacteria bacterium]
MPRFIYTAKESIVSNGLVVSGSDISADSVTNSFKSTTSDLSGWLANEWIYVDVGVNPGWHQVSVDSTTNEIKTTSTLTNEAAGALTTITGYEHGLGEQYEIEFDCAVSDRKRQRVGKTSTSKSGRKQYARQRIERRFMVDVVAIAEDNLKYWDEFIDSVMGMETFEFDRVGTIAIPGTTEIVQLESDDVSEIRRGMSDEFNLPQLSLYKAV